MTQPPRTASTHVGKLITFHTDPYLKIPVFVSGEADRCIIWVGGQCDGFFVNQYMPLLSEELPKIGWCMAQMMTSSAFMGHGSHTHVQDAEDLDDLIKTMVSEHGMKEVTLFASSTGVQIALEEMENGENAEAITRVILQGVVCNPEDPFFTKETEEKRRDVARDLCLQGREEEVSDMRAFYDIPVSAARVNGGGNLTLMEALWVPAHREEHTTIVKNIAAIRVPLLVMIAFGPNYFFSREDRRGFETVLRAAASTSELTIQWLHCVCDERRRMLKAEEPKITADIIFFLAEQDSKRKRREEEEAAAHAEFEKRNRSVLAKSTLKLQ